MGEWRLKIHKYNSRSRSYLPVSGHAVAMSVAYANAVKRCPRKVALFSTNVY